MSGPAPLIIFWIKTPERCRAGPLLVSQTYSRGSTTRKGRWPAPPALVQPDLAYGIAREGHRRLPALPCHRQFCLAMLSGYAQVRVAISDRLQPAGADYVMTERVRRMGIGLRSGREEITVEAALVEAARHASIIRQGRGLGDEVRSVRPLACAEPPRPSVRPHHTQCQHGCRRHSQMQASSPLKRFNSHDTDHDLCEFVDSLGFTGIGTAELEKQRAAYREFIAPFAASLVKVGCTR
jgi:hypothetical protein